MVKKDNFKGVVRIEFENGKATEVTCLSVAEGVMEIRHDAENKANRHKIIEGDSLQVRAGERLVLVMAESYAKSGVINEGECAEVHNLYRDVRRFRHNRLRIKIFAPTAEGELGQCVGYVWISKGKGVAEGDTTDTPSNANTDNSESDNDLSEFGFIGISLIIPTKGGYSTESKADEPSKSKNEPLTAHVTAAGADYEIDAVIKFLNPQTDAQSIIIKSDALTRKLSDIINYWEN